MSSAEWDKLHMSFPSLFGKNCFAPLLFVIFEHIILHTHSVKHWYHHLQEGVIGMNAASNSVDFRILAALHCSTIV